MSKAILEARPGLLHCFLCGGGHACADHALRHTLAPAPIYLELPGEFGWAQLVWLGWVWVKVALVGLGLVGLRWLG